MSIGRGFYKAGSKMTECTWTGTVFLGLISKLEQLAAACRAAI